MIILVFSMFLESELERCIQHMFRYLFAIIHPRETLGYTNLRVKAKLCGMNGRLAFSICGFFLIRQKNANRKIKNRRRSI